MNRKCDDDTIILISLVLRIAYRHSRQPNKRWISLSNDHVKWAKPANVTDPTDSNPYETTTNQARESSRQFVAPNLTTSITCQLQPCTIWRWLAEDGRSIQDICTATTTDDEMILSRSHSNGKSSFFHFGVLCRWHFEICMSLVLSRGVGCWCMGRGHAVWMHQVDGGRGGKANTGRRICQEKETISLSEKKMLPLLMLLTKCCSCQSNIPVLLLLLLLPSTALALRPSSPQSAFANEKQIYFLFHQSFMFHA